MALCLTITSYHKITPGQRPDITVDTGAISIGRSPENDWTLPDPERLVSSRHCVVQFRDGRYYITDSSTNGVELVNAGVRLRRGNSEPLMDGEVIRIGEYEIQARIDSGFSVEAVSQPGAQSFEALMANQVAAASAPVAPVPVSFPQGASSHDTLPDLFDFLGPSSVPPASQPDHVPAQQHDFRPPVPVAPAPAPPPPTAPSAPAAGVIPADWNPFDDAPAPAPTTPEVAPVLPPLPAFEPTPPPEPAPLLAPVAPAAPVEPALAPVAPAPAAAPASATGMAEPALLQAFLRGAGIEHLRIDADDAAAQMEAVGRSYRLMVEGLIDVLRARASLKGEFRMQQTTIAPVQNNPLKFAPNADEALLLLLRQGSQAFMPADQAVRDSFDDLRAHQLAVMAGVEAAIKHLLVRFEPGQLEGRLAPAAGLAKLFGGSRQAHLWQQFTELYGQISREAQDDFQDLFGREFSRAYEAHNARLQRS
ncbi:type VI secretion system-associated FHA domain protein TagH [Pseudomonas sp. S75]|uniref:type VI secretion system-associated FHA domain protein TagH n=1 Tax=unclassified Pseudomonas TaxID=196821 RepID=UPI0019030314|nr:MULTISPECIES: type VI secretion system-associated FHA domain protein TagH [unclassified Pseudomonas]MBJ9977389.1 type VI secretion system-associated FHA domain protein TagH [Pseudomonas sp. S30]MBK0154799.1 type VI secretion system-associated FHA domain protein TagH [Pseudomonas sp. S75]